MKLNINFFRHRDAEKTQVRLKGNQKIPDESVD